MNSIQIADQQPDLEAYEEEADREPAHEYSPSSILDLEEYPETTEEFLARLDIPDRRKSGGDRRIRTRDRRYPD